MWFPFTYSERSQRPSSMTAAPRSVNSKRTSGSVGGVAVARQGTSSGSLGGTSLVPARHRWSVCGVVFDRAQNAEQIPKLGSEEYGT
jgi:hypothetical protein